MQEQYAGEHRTSCHAPIFGERHSAGARNIWLAYLLALPLGWLGIHRLYLGRRLTGFIMMGLSVTALLVLAAVQVLDAHMLVAMLWDAVAGLLLLVAGAWELVDLFLVPLMVRRFNRTVPASLDARPHLQQPV